MARPESAAQKKRAKAERKTPDDQTRLHINVGEEMGVVPIDIVNSIAGETGLPGNVVGKVDIRERHSFVDVSSRTRQRHSRQAQPRADQRQQGEDKSGVSHPLLCAFVSSRLCVRIFA